jgi:predicted nucleic acid-binding protein
VALLIDTDLLVDRERGVGTAAAEAALGDEDRAISVVTMSELLHGVSRATGPIRARRRAFVEYLLAELQAIPITEPVARVHAEMWVELAGRGMLIGPHDLWIAATALTYGLGLATRNAHEFDRVPGLRVVATPG